MHIDADENAAPSSQERILKHLETTVPDCNLTILGRALLINSYGGANEAQITGLLTLSPLGVARVATQCSADAEPEWERVESLEVELRRSWLLYETHLAQLHLDLFRERGPTGPPVSSGRVFVPAVEEIMWPAWIRAFSSPAFTDTGLLEAMPDGLSQPWYPCEEPPSRQRFLDVTLRTRLLQVAMAVRVVLQYGCAAAQLQ
ncbi:hypothetical protein COCOBI_08-0760 [Coccomyxa sp. Obi]|nr:hypothetical protein COCOBI_08-0760 [Coccomyxa sp. Obi]